MEKLSKKQRNIIYRNVLQNNEFKKGRGICSAISDQCSINTYHYWEFSNKDDYQGKSKYTLCPKVKLPEIYMLSDSECYWRFDETNPIQVREIILLFCIEMTND